MEQNECKFIRVSAEESLKQTEYVRMERYVSAKALKKLREKPYQLLYAEKTAKRTDSGN